MNNSKKILVVGQTPPPFGGQAIMIESMLNGCYKNLKFYHVRMAFSKEMDQIGKLNIFKIFHLFEVVLRILYCKFTHDVNTLYYPPTGPNHIPFYRDAFILILVRPFFKEVYFHFHASGISELYGQLNPFSRFIFRKAYYRADLGIRLSQNSPDDCVKLKIKNEYIIPNGIPDFSSDFPRQKSAICTILFVGLLNESKGLLILLEASYILRQSGIKFQVLVMGKFESEEFQKRIENLVKKYDLSHYVTFLGVLTGSEKFRVYAGSDIFCFPTFFDAENFPVVLLEASSFSLPLVSTEWRGIPSIIQNDVNGFLVPIKNGEAVANKLQILITDGELRNRMGLRARELFLNKYSLDQYYTNIERAFTSL